MVIIKQGKIKTTKMMFTCRECGCVFVAERGEYRLTTAQYNETAYDVVCPFCHRQAYYGEYEVKKVQE